MGFAVPGAIGAQLATPFSRVVVLVGDGAFRMTGMELMVAKRLGLNPIVIVINNGSYASLRAMGHRQADFVELSSLDYAKLAEVLGGQGFAIQTGEELRKALHVARDSNTFSILDVRLSPDDVSPTLARVSDLFAKTLKG